LRGSDNDGHDDKGLGDGCSGGRAGLAGPAEAALCPCNRSGARGRGGGRGSDYDGSDYDGNGYEGNGDGSCGGRAGRAEPAEEALCPRNRRGASRSALTHASLFCSDS
jgi:hypothetical protein